MDPDSCEPELFQGFLWSQLISNQNVQPIRRTNIVQAADGKLGMIKNHHDRFGFCDHGGFEGSHFDIAVRRPGNVVEPVCGYNGDIDLRKIVQKVNCEVAGSHGFAPVDAASDEEHLVSGMGGQLHRNMKIVGDNGQIVSLTQQFSNRQACGVGADGL